jgi:DNA-directed RNA polymerase specialized sigma24 family protein
MDGSRTQPPIWTRERLAAIPVRSRGCRPQAGLGEGLHRHRSVRIALDRLPERQPLAVVLVYDQGLRDGEAAELMGISVEALESPPARARRTLRRLEPVTSGRLGAP